MIDGEVLGGGALQRDVTSEKGRDRGVGVAGIARHGRAIGQRDAHRRWLGARYRSLDKLGPTTQQLRPETRGLPTQHLACLGLDERVRAVADETVRGHLGRRELLALHRLDRKP